MRDFTLLNCLTCTCSLAYCPNLMFTSSQFLLPAERALLVQENWAESHACLYCAATELPRVGVSGLDPQTRPISLVTRVFPHFASFFWLTSSPFFFSRPLFPFRILSLMTPDLHSTTLSPQFSQSKQPICKTTAYQVAQPPFQCQVTLLTEEFGTSISAKYILNYLPPISIQSLSFLFFSFS